MLGPGGLSLTGAGTYPSRTQPGPVSLDPRSSTNVVPGPKGWSRFKFPYTVPFRGPVTLKRLEITEQSRTVTET